MSCCDAEAKTHKFTRSLHRRRSAVQIYTENTRVTGVSRSGGAGAVVQKLGCCWGCSAEVRVLLGCSAEVRVLLGCSAEVRVLLLGP